MLRRREPSHQIQHAGMVGVNLSEQRAFFASAPDASYAIDFGIEPGMTGALAMPANASDLEHYADLC
jgi:hypothetical protein